MVDSRYLAYRYTVSAEHFIECIILLSPHIELSTRTHTQQYMHFSADIGDLLYKYLRGKTTT